MTTRKLISQVMISVGLVTGIDGGSQYYIGNTATAWCHLFMMAVGLTLAGWGFDMRYEK